MLCNSFTNNFGLVINLGGVFECTLLQTTSSLTGICSQFCYLCWIFLDFRPQISPSFFLLTIKGITMIFTRLHGYRYSIHRNAVSAWLFRGRRNFSSSRRARIFGLLAAKLSTSFDRCCHYFGEGIAHIFWLGIIPVVLNLFRPDSIIILQIISLSILLIVKLLVVFLLFHFVTFRPLILIRWSLLFLAFVSLQHIWNILRMERGGGTSFTLRMFARFLAIFTRKLLETWNRTRIRLLDLANFYLNVSKFDRRSRLSRRLDRSEFVDFT